MKGLDLNNVSDLDESFSGFSNYYAYPKNDKYSNVDGGDGNEDSVEDEGEGSEESVPSQDLPKFRQLVKAKKLELKAQYGKGHFDNRSEMERKCQNIKYPCPTFKNPFKSCDKEVCANVPKISVVWVSGWRAKWKEFKRQGGLAQLKQMALGTRPLNNSPINPQIDTATPTTSQDNSSTVKSTKSNTSSNKYNNIDKKVGTTFGINSIAFYSGIGISVLAIGLLVFKIIKNKK